MAKRERSVLEKYFFLILGISFTGLGGFFLILLLISPSAGYFLNEGLIFLGFGICSILVFIFDKSK
ncbi:MAG: hypothetical protein HWN67_20305 [Candidatus Helarchaeota archaeon]|nr:hypothetical protein [Candidatus Helarchaeota archaeon]